jgi:hypothetical protein
VKVKMGVGHLKLNITNSSHGVFLSVAVALTDVSKIGKVLNGLLKSPPSL